MLESKTPFVYFITSSFSKDDNNGNAHAIPNFKK